MTEDIKKACQVMSEGGIILYPTDTIWGIGCDATNAEAVRRVYEIKQRSDSKAMLVLVDSPVKVDFYVQDVPDIAWDLIELADKPLTIIYSGARNLAPQPACRRRQRGHTRHERGVLETPLSPVPKSDRLHLRQHQRTALARLFQRNQRRDQVDGGLCGRISAG